VRRLFRFIDWMMDLPPALQQSFTREVFQYEEVKGMPFITSVERDGIRAGLLQGIEVSLDIKFGADGLKLLPEIRKIQDHEKLAAVLHTIRSAATPEEVRRAWSP
jgi:hypothetical protein